MPGTLARPQQSRARPVIRAAALQAAPRVPIYPDFLKLSPGFTDSAEQVSKLYLFQQGHDSSKKEISLKISQKVYQTGAKEIRCNSG